MHRVGCTYPTPGAIKVQRTECVDFSIAVECQVHICEHQQDALRRAHFVTKRPAKPFLFCATTITPRIQGRVKPRQIQRLARHATPFQFPFPFPFPFPFLCASHVLLYELRATERQGDKKAAHSVAHLFSHTTAGTLPRHMSERQSMPRKKASILPMPRIQVRRGHSVSAADAGSGCKRPRLAAHRTGRH